MFKFLKKIKGQSTVEYAILIIIIIGALLTIQVYIKRGVQGRLKSASDDIGEQYSPGNTNYTSTVSTHSKTREENLKGVQNLIFDEDESTNIFHLALGYSYSHSCLDQRSNVGGPRCPNIKKGGKGWCGGLHSAREFVNIDDRWNIRDIVLWLPR